MKYERIIKNALKSEKKRLAELQHFMFPMSQNNVEITLQNLAVEIIRRIHRRSLSTEKLEEKKQ